MPIYSSSVGSFSTDQESNYEARLPFGLSIFDDLYKAADSNVITSTKQLLLLFVQYFYKAMLTRASELESKRLSRFKYIADDNNSFSIEWNYESFRIGFSFDIIIQEYAYYAISYENGGNSFNTTMKTFDLSDMGLTVAKALDYAIQNS